MTAGAFVALDHLIVAVRDLEAASATYESLLGRAHQMLLRNARPLVVRSARNSAWRTFTSRPPSVVT